MRPIAGKRGRRVLVLLAMGSAFLFAGCAGTMMESDKAMMKEKGGMMKQEGSMMKEEKGTMEKK